MKKILLCLVLVGMLFAYTPAMAQTTPTADEITQQLIVLLTETVARLQAQIAELVAQQATQTQVIQQQSQVIDQIAQGTTTIQSAVCTPTWQCSEWSSCTSSSQTRTCTDSSNCGVSSSKPPESQSCTENLIFTEVPKLVWSGNSLSRISYQTNRPSTIFFGPVINNSSDPSDWTTQYYELTMQSCPNGVSRKLAQDNPVGTYKCTIKAKDNYGKTVEYTLDVKKDSIDLTTN